jgi:hypothetical protein
MNRRGEPDVLGPKSEPRRDQPPIVVKAQREPARIADAANEARFGLRQLAHGGSISLHGMNGEPIFPGRLMETPRAAVQRFHVRIARERLAHPD